MTALRGGSSIAAVAKQHGVAVQKVIDALVADEEKELADQVANGQLTQAQADQRKTGIAAHIADRVNGTAPAGGPGRHGFGGPGGPGQPDQPAGADQQESPTA